MTQIILEKNGKYWEKRSFDGRDVWSDKDRACRMPLARALTRAKTLQKIFVTKIKLEKVK